MRSRSPENHTEDLGQVGVLKTDGEIARALAAPGLIRRRRVFGGIDFIDRGIRRRSGRQLGIDPPFSVSTLPAGEGLLQGRDGTRFGRGQDGTARGRREAEEERRCYPKPSAASVGVSSRRWAAIWSGAVWAVLQAGFRRSMDRLYRPGRARD